MAVHLNFQFLITSPCVNVNSYSKIILKVLDNERLNNAMYVFKNDTQVYY